MNPILCIETSGALCSVALFDGELMLSFRQHAEPNAHAGVLFVLIEACMKEAGLKSQQLKAVSVSKGPGSYTGLRIGVAAAKGICHATGAKLLSVSTLQLMAREAIQEKVTAIVPMIDARRNEVYTAIYDAGGKEITSPFPLILTDESYHDILEKGSVMFVGNGALKWQQQCRHHHAHFRPEVVPVAQNMGKLSWPLFLQESFENLAYFEPEYVKPVFIQARP